MGMSSITFAGAHTGLSTEGYWKLNSEQRDLDHPLEVSVYSKVLSMKNTQAAVKSNCSSPHASQQIQDTRATRAGSKYGRTPWLCVPFNSPLNDDVQSSSYFFFLLILFKNFYNFGHALRYTGS